MTKFIRLCALTAVAACATDIHAAIITVTTTNNVSPGPGETNLFYAISLANTNGDTSNTIKFNIPGAGPHYLTTPTNGYPLITNHNITIDGYSQPGSAPNSNPILASNNAKIKIVLDSRIDPNSTDFLGTDMNYAPGAGNTGFGSGDVGILGLFRATNFHAQGLCFLGQFSANYDMYCVAIACDLQGTSHHAHVSGCWFGVDLDGTSVVGGCVQAIDNARHRDNPATQQATSDFMTVGVKAGSANPRAEFNVMLGMIETIGIEGNNARISGNFIGVFPDGLHDWIGPRDGDPAIPWDETHVEIGRANNNTVIGTDGDGVNDADERNIIGGVVDQALWVTATGLPRGYTHVIEFYGNNTVISGTNYGPGTNVVVAGNYFGVGIDGTTRFTNGVPAIDGTSPQLRFESNVVFNNYPTNIFDPTLAATRGFFDGIGAANIISARGNKLVNNYPFPTHPQKSGGFLTNYYNKALAVPTDANSDVFPVLSTNTTLLRLVGKVPIANTNYPATIIDLYIPDPEGITNGMAAMDPDLPNGWVQGLTYLGSFVEGSTNDLNPAPGQFEFDISKLDLRGATRLTITANYSKSPATTPNAVILTSPFSDPYTIPPFIPGGVASVGLTHVVPDMPVWYSSAQLPGHPFPGYVTNGPVDTAAQVSVTSQANGNWEPYISVVGDSTFLIGAGMFADDGSWAGSTNLMGSRPNQRYIVTLQPAAGGPPKIGEVFYEDFGQPYRLHTMMRQRNPGVRLAGDKRSGATTFMAGGTAALLYGKFWFGIDYFNTDGRYSTNFPLYGTGFGSVNNQDGAGNPPGTTDFQSVSVQTYSLNTATLAQTPLTKAFDATYGLSWRNQVPVELCNNAGLACGNGGSGSDNEAYFGGELAALDNGNFVVVVNDYTGFFATNRIAQPSTVATIVRADGSVVKDTWLVDPREIWSNVAAYSGGFCARVQTTLYFYDNVGNLKATNTVVASSGVGYDTGRGDGTRIASDIRSHYVYLAGPTAVPGGVGCSLGIWDARTGAFVTNAIVSETDPGLTAVDRVGLAVDGLDRVCVAYATKPDKTPFTQFQIAARVMKFDGANVNFLTHSFFPFVSHDSDPANVLGYVTSNPNVAMTTRQICIAAKGTINGANNAAGGPTTSVETTLYAVINHPDPKPTLFVGVPGDQLFDDPSGGWTYVLDGSSATAGAANSGFTSLDGTWSHGNGSDTWDGSAIGGTFVAGSNAPGGVSSIDGYLRIEDPGDPRPAFPDPGNRKIYFGHNISAEGASASVLNDGVTLHFRARIPTAGLLDDRFITAQTNYPAGGDGYLIHDGGKGNFGIKQASGGIVSFSLTTAADTGTSAGLLMNSRNGTAVSAAVDSGDGGTTNILALDPTRWHEFWITIRADTTAQGTHKVDVYLDGSLTPSTFYVTAGDGSDFTGISYIAMGCGATGQSGAFDVDYFTYKLGAVAPASSAVPLFTSGSLVSGNIVGMWAGGRPPYTVEAKSVLTNAEWVDLVTFSNTSAQTPAAGPAAFFRVANRVVFNVSLNGANERPSPVTTAASAGGTLTLDGNKLTVDVTYANLSASLTGVHFHGSATAAETAGVIINLQSLNTGTTSGSIRGSVTMTAQQVRWLLNGLLYMNIHTGNNPGGEIRGQISAVQKLQFVARLNGANERPTPIATSGQGAAMLVLDNNQLKLDLNYYGLSGPATAAHIHGPGTTEQAVGVLVPIDSLGVNPPLGASGRYSGTLTLTAAQILNLLDGLTYLNIHTSLNTGGEIRGQITP